MPGWGSAIAAGMLAEAGQEFDFIDVTGFDQPGKAREMLAGLDRVAPNPLLQVPALVLPDGTLMTETAAIALYFDLVPAVEKPRFLRLLIWLVANIYPTFTYGDYPQLWAPTAAAELVASTDAHRKQLWLWLEMQVGGPYSLGETFSVLDIYLTVMVTWRPREPWFAQHAPKLLAAAHHTRKRPSLAKILAENGIDAG